MPELIDSNTPTSTKTRSGFHGWDYELISKEFETDGHIFYLEDDPFWEATNLWYGSPMISSGTTHLRLPQKTASSWFE